MPVDDSEVEEHLISVRGVAGGGNRLRDDPVAGRDLCLPAAGPEVHAVVHVVPAEGVVTHAERRGHLKGPRNDGNEEASADDGLARASPASRRLLGLRGRRRGFLRTVLPGLGLSRGRGGLRLAAVFGVDRCDLRSRGVAGCVDLLDRRLELALLSLQLLGLGGVRRFKGRQLLGLRLRGALLARLVGHERVRLRLQLSDLLAHGALAGLAISRHRRLLLDLLELRGLLAECGAGGRNRVIEVLRGPRSDHEVPCARESVSAVLGASDRPQVLAGDGDGLLPRTDLLFDRVELRLRGLKLARHDFLLAGGGSQL